MFKVIYRLSLFERLRLANMEIRKKLSFLLKTTLIIFYGCEDEKVTENIDLSSIIETPVTYTFNSRFVSDESSVSYSDQVNMNMMVLDLKTMTDFPGTSSGLPIAMENMTRLYEYDESYNFYSWINTDPYSSQKFYNNISSSGPNLAGQINNDEVHGFDEMADSLIINWMQEIADNSNNFDKAGSFLAITDQNGLNLSEMINKTILGAVLYYRGIPNNLEILDNSKADSEDSFYSSLEHSWDESFGYFGASADYNTGYLDDIDRIEDPFFDSDSDGVISFKSEYIFNNALIAAQRDSSVMDESVNFTKSIFDAFLEGRTLIHNQESIDKILAQGQIIANNWEKVIAATIIHNINKLDNQMSDLEPSSGPLSFTSADYNKYWSRMRAFTISLQYNNVKLISDADLLMVVDLMGETPIYPSNELFSTYRITLTETVKNILQSAYNFSDTSIRDW